MTLLLLQVDACRRRVVGLKARGQAWLQRVPVVIVLALGHREVEVRDHDHREVEVRDLRGFLFTMFPDQEP